MKSLCHSADPEQQNNKLSPFENKQTNKQTVNSKWITDLNVKIKTIKCPEKEIDKNIYDFALEKDL